MGEMTGVPYEHLDAKTGIAHGACEDAAAPRTGSWTVTVQDQIYGPYDLSQMLAFIAQGRIVSSSLVSEFGSRIVHPLSEDPVLSPLFYSARPREPAASGTHAVDAQQEQGATKSADGTAAQAMNHIMIAAEIKWSVAQFEAALFSLGPFYQLMETCWILATRESFETVRKTLTHNVVPTDKFFLSDLTHNRASWFNLGQEAERRIAGVWRRPATPGA